VDTAQHLDQVWVGGQAGAATVTAQAGVTLDRLWEALGSVGLAVGSTPAPGHLTLGGALAIGAHGTALPAPGAGPRPGWTFGSLSNAVLSLEAVAWDPGTGRYALRTFAREDPAIGPLLVHAGRAFITSATLQAGEDVHLQLRSFTDIPAAELFAPPANAGARSFQAWAAQAGRVEVTWFPFTGEPWMRVWSLAPDQPGQAVALDGPYPFTFANWISREDSAYTAAVLRDDPGWTPTFLALAMAAVRAGLVLTRTADVWGPSRFTTLHVQPSTMRYHVSGHAILCRTGEIQRVVSELYAYVNGALETCRARGEFPVNGPMDLRVSSLDRTSDVVAEAPREPLLSPLRVRPDHPLWDCVVWVEILTLPGTQGAGRFYTDLEGWLLENYRGDYAAVRLEWAKGWAYTPRGAWTAAPILAGHLPESFTSGYPSGEDWSAAVRGLQALDPAGVYGNAFLDALFGPG
jgi:FAD/FMN-containing dehydrogenase